MTEASRDLAAADPLELAEQLSAAPVPEASERLLALIRGEERLVRENLLKPYLDKVPKVLTAMAPEQAAAVLERLPAEDVKRALFGNYARVRDSILRTVLGSMSPDRAALLIDAMAVGVDPPREMARVLGGISDGSLGPALAAAHPASMIRLLRAMDRDDQQRVVLASGVAQAARVAGALLDDDNSVSAAWAERLVGALDPTSRRDVERALTVPQRELLERASLERRDEPSAHALRSEAAKLSDADTDTAADRLLGLHPLAAVQALRLVGARRAAELLTRLARRNAAVAADLLEATSPPLLLRRPLWSGPPSWWLRECPAAPILEALDVDEPAARELLGRIRPERGALFLEHVSERRRSELGTIMLAEEDPGLALSLEAMGVGTGRRATRTLDCGIRWVRINEELDSGDIVKPVIIDLLELDLDRVELAARIATRPQSALPAARIAEIFEDYRSSGRRPGSDEFRRFGLVQLSSAVRDAGAIAAINGNFYFDYGHYINGITLGVDIASVPGLYFGDPIGWFVNDGRELIPPSFNRAAGIVTEDGEFHIDRVFMTGVTLASGTRVAWDALNALKQPGRIHAYNSLWGYRTDAAESHVDVAIARGVVAAVSRAGGQVIPLTGFVLSIPRERSDLLAGLETGLPVTVHNNFPATRGRVLHAMACGPSLVRDGVLDTDFEGEDFGQQDSTVMSFFLPRSVETYEAARSFMAVRDRTLILGSVSGMAYGFGRAAASGGMTFGELAQLCLDLGADRAYALDGGGSSSVVARAGGEPRVLNAPTGGADVGIGEERFINTYWLVYPRKSEGVRT